MWAHTPAKLARTTAARLPVPQALSVPREMSSEPTEDEKSDLRALAKAGVNHFKLLIGVLVSATLAFWVPDKFKMAFILIAAALAIVYGVSHINMQFYQRCPRCQHRLNMASPQCRNCGLNIGLGSKKGDGSEWLQ